MHVKNYTEILSTIISLNISIDSKKGGKETQMAYFQAVELSLTVEHISLDGENLLFQLISAGAIDNLWERSQFNKRRRKLFLLMEPSDVNLIFFLEFEDYFVINSMPLEICKIARHKRLKVYKEHFDTVPEKVIANLKTYGSMDINYMVYD